MKEDPDNTELGEDYDQIGPFIDSSMHPIQYIPPPIWVKILQLKKADIHLTAAAKSFEQDYEPYLVAVTSGIAKRGEEAQDLQLHPHHVLDKEKPDYWNNIIEYLQTLKVPKLKIIHPDSQEFHLQRILMMKDKRFTAKGNLRQEGTGRTHSYLMEVSKFLLLAKHASRSCITLLDM